MQDSCVDGVAPRRVDRCSLPAVAQPAGVGGRRRISRRSLHPGGWPV